MILIVAESLKIFFMINFVSVCYCQNVGGLLALSKSDDKYFDDPTDALSSEQLKSVYDVAKNISHSRGSIIKSKEGDYEYRRSFTTKVEYKVNYLQMQNSVLKIKEILTKAEYNKTQLLEDLYFLEGLVHQYDIGKTFSDIGGFNLILNLTMDKDDDISNYAFKILSAALQGNSEVQKFAQATDLLKIINEKLYPPSPAHLNSALLTLSTFIRNHPESLKAFIDTKGIYTLSFILENYFNVTKIQLRTIDILNDMTVELLTNSSLEIINLKRNFVADVQSYLVCKKILEVFSVSEEYTTHEKIIAALNSMFEICKNSFLQPQFIKKLKNLIEHYSPSNVTKMWYTQMIDPELADIMYQNIKNLYVKLLSYEASIKNVKNEL